MGDNLPTPAHVVALLKSRGLKHAKIYDADRPVLTAFKNSGIQLMVLVPNELVIDIANSQTFSHAWVKDNVVDFKDDITFIGMGNEWLLDGSHDMTKLVPAMENLHQSLLQMLGPSSRIKVSTCHAFNVGGFPPSQGSFPVNTVAEMTDLLSSLQRTKSVFMLNVYPFFAYVETPAIDINYALFTLTGAGVYDNASN